MRLNEIVDTIQIGIESNRDWIESRFAFAHHWQLFV